ncbi:MAG: sensor histidine kinase, partial [Nocardioidaceae bacterium]
MAGLRRRARRRLTATVMSFVLAVALPLLLTAALVPLRPHLTLVSDILLFLLTAVMAALLGGLLPALLAAVLASMLLNYYFTPPLHALTIDRPGNALALVVFVVVAMLVSGAVDMAARRTRQRDRAEAESRILAEANKVRTALLAAVGHDLRSPLAAAKAAVSSMLSSDVTLDPNDRRELIHTADESLDRLTALVGNLLDLSRLQAGVMPMRLGPVVVDEVVATTLDAMGAMGLRVRVELPDGLPDVVADAGLLERVLVNLADNALRHSPTGRPPTLDAALAPGRVELRLRDHGPGIRAADRDRVFLPFQRLGDTDNTQGIGLGLALCRGLTEAMGGRLEPRETPGGGLTMVVVLNKAANISVEEPTSR